MRIRHLVLATSLLAGLPLAAYAADLAPQPVEPAPPIVEPYSWTGFYAGINGGYAFGTKHHVRMNEDDGPNLLYGSTYGDLTPKGGFGGIQAGYNQQFGGFVFGLEADIQGAGIAGKTTSTDFSADYTLTTKSRTNWFGTVRPRIGYAFDNILIYATGGLAFGGVKYKQDYLDFGSIPHYTSYPSKSDTRIGYALGGGVEYAITQNWSVKLEYQYVDLGRSNLDGVEVRSGLPTEYSIHTKLRTDFHIVRLGLNYRF